MPSSRAIVLLMLIMPWPAHLCILQNNMINNSNNDNDVNIGNIVAI
jgi:hypothetical protein